LQEFHQRSPAGWDLAVQLKVTCGELGNKVVVGNEKEACLKQFAEQLQQELDQARRSQKQKVSLLFVSAVAAVAVATEAADDNDAADEDDKDAIVLASWVLVDVVVVMVGVPILVANFLGHLQQITSWPS